MERKISFTFLFVVKRQMGRSGVTTWNSVTYENTKFYETWKSDRTLLDNVILEIAKKIWLF